VEAGAVVNDLALSCALIDCLELFKLSSAMLHSALSHSLYSDATREFILNLLKRPDFNPLDTKNMDPRFIDTDQDDRGILTSLSNYIDAQYREYIKNIDKYIAPVGCVIQSTGTGKSRTLVEYCKTRNQGSIYVVFPHMNKDHEEAHSTKSLTWPFFLPSMDQFQSSVLQYYKSCRHHSQDNIIELVQIFELWFFNDVQQIQ